MGKQAEVGQISSPAAVSEELCAHLQVALRMYCSGVQDRQPSFPFRSLTGSGKLASLDVSVGTGFYLSELKTSLTAAEVIHHFLMLQDSFKKHNF